ncbi:MAG: hypothetical protein HYU70_14400 [Bacteroidetes bacterium]|nr:hypothetical protein [Bacteroidota bacterium]
MTNSEFKNKVAEATDLEWFKGVQETFNFSYSDYIQPLTGITAIYEFINQQINGWEKLNVGLPNELSYSLTYFQEIKKRILEFVNNYLNQEGKSLNSYWSNVKNQINNFNHRPLSFNSPYTEFLIKVHKEFPSYFNGAYNFLLGTNNYNLNSKEQLFGAILAFDFLLKDKSSISKRIDTEQKSLSKLKTDFQNYLSESETTIIEHIKKTNDAYNNYTTQIDDLKNEKETLFSNWFENTKVEHWEKWYAEKQDKLQKLEHTYEAKLKLEKPAKYWQTKSTNYYKQATATRNIILVIVGLVCVFLAVILISAPDWIFKNVFKENSTAIVRWSITLLIFISLIAYTIKALTKYMFSSFHLARDAEERHTLTFFYLALTKDTEVKDDDRKLILQSLFSRSDTGLLKEDSSPTMPSDSISKIVAKS